MNNDSGSERAVDCYPAVIAALTEGALVTFNGADPTQPTFGEYEVEWASEDGEAGLKHHKSGFLTVERDPESDDGGLALFDANGEWPERLTSIDTIEVVGLA